MAGCDGFLRRIDAAVRETAGHLIVQDLEWTRSYALRVALAAQFDEPAAVRHLPAVREARIVHHPAHRNAALLLLSWFAGSCGWRRAAELDLALPRGAAAGGWIAFDTPGGGPARALLEADPAGPPLASFELSGDELRLEISAAARGVELALAVRRVRAAERGVPAGRAHRSAALVADQLSRGGKNSLLLKVLPMFRELSGEHRDDHGPRRSRKLHLPRLRCRGTGGLHGLRPLSGTGAFTEEAAATCRAAPVGGRRIPRRSRPAGRGLQLRRLRAARVRPPTAPQARAPVVVVADRGAVVSVVRLVGGAQPALKPPLPGKLTLSPGACQPSVAPMKRAFLCPFLLLAFDAAARAGLDPASFDTSAKPQDDFFQYANGGWLKTVEIPPEQATWGSFVELTQENRKRLREICEQAAAKGDAGSPVERMVGDFYASGMDEAAINAAGIAPLQPELERIAAIRTAAGVHARHRQAPHARRAGRLRLRQRAGRR